MEPNHVFVSSFDMIMKTKFAELGSATVKILRILEIAMQFLTFSHVPNAKRLRTPKSKLAKIEKFSCYRKAKLFGAPNASRLSAPKIHGIFEGFLRILREFFENIF